MRQLFYSLARLLGWVSLLNKPTPRRISRKAKNVAIGRALNKFKVWR